MRKPWGHLDDLRVLCTLNHDFHKTLQHQIWQKRQNASLQALQPLTSRSPDSYTASYESRCAQEQNICHGVLSIQGALRRYRLKERNPSRHGKHSIQTPGFSWKLRKRMRENPCRGSSWRWLMIPVNSR